MAGVDAGPMTLRQLVHVYNAVRRDRWERSSFLMAVIANCHRGKGQRAFQPADFNPLDERHSTPRGIAVNKGTMRALAKAIAGKSREAGR